MASTIGGSVSEEATAAGRLGSLIRRSDAIGCGQLAGHLGALIVTGWLVGASMGRWWLPLALVGHGFVLVFLFAPLHETIHRSAFRSRWLNGAVSWCCGLVLMLPPGYFRAFHFAHHRHTQDPVRDPELATPKPQGWRSYLWTVSGIPFWRERVTTTFRHAAGRVVEPFIGATARASIVREARIVLGIYATIAIASIVLQTLAPIYYWLLPVLLGQPFLRMFLLAEHTGCPLVPDMYANTRTTLTNRAMRRLAWNMPYHTAHHVYPGVPFHALPETHRRIRARVCHEARGYRSVQEQIVRGFRRGERSP